MVPSTAPHCREDHFICGFSALTRFHGSRSSCRGARSRSVHGEREHIVGPSARASDDQLYDSNRRRARMERCAARHRNRAPLLDRAVRLNFTLSSSMRTDASSIPMGSDYGVNPAESRRTTRIGSSTMTVAQLAPPAPSSPPSAAEPFASMTSLSRRGMITDENPSVSDPQDLACDSPRRCMPRCAGPSKWAVPHRSSRRSPAPTVAEASPLLESPGPSPTKLVVRGGVTSSHRDSAGEFWSLRPRCWPWSD